MKKTLIFSLLLFLCTPVFAAVELDSDHNGATDISKGGTNSTTIAGAKTNLGIPSTLAALTGDSTHRVVTDAEKAAWDAKQSALNAGTDYLAPNGSAEHLTNFPSSLATDSEVSAAVDGKEASLGNPATSGWCLQSTTGGVRSWGVCGSGSFDATADQTITGSYDFTGGFSAKNVWLGLGDISDFKIKGAPVSAGSFVSGSTYVITSVGTTDFTAIGADENTIGKGFIATGPGSGTGVADSYSNVVDPSSGDGDTNHTWPADKIFDQLATKQPLDSDLTLAAGATGAGNSKYFGTNSSGTAGFFDLPSGGSGTSGYVSLSAAPYSDVACTTGQYGYYESTAYLCTNGFWTSKWALTTHTNATPVSQCSQIPSYDQSLTGGDTGWYLGGYSVGALYTGASSYTICSLGFNINSIVGNINSQTYSVNIYTRSGNNLGTLLATKQITGSLITTGWNNITLDSPISTGTSGFAIVITGPMDGTNYPIISTMNSNGDSSWSTHRWSGTTDNLTIDNDMALRIYQ